MPISRLSRFLLAGIAWLVALMLPWYYVSPYLAAPVVWLAGEAMQVMFWWVDDVERAGCVATLLTRLDVLMNAGDHLVKAQLTPEVNFRTFGYGTVLQWALLLASRAERLPLKLVLGTAALMPLQAVSLCFQWLRDVAINSGAEALRQTGMGRWSLELIAYGYQFGFLMLTPLAPVVLWLALDRKFVTGLWIETKLAATLEGSR